MKPFIRDIFIQTIQTLPGWEDYTEICQAPLLCAKWEGVKEILDSMFDPDQIPRHAARFKEVSTAYNNLIQFGEVSYFSTDAGVLVRIVFLGDGSVVYREGLKSTAFGSTSEAVYKLRERFTEDEWERYQLSPIFGIKEKKKCLPEWKRLGLGERAPFYRHERDGKTIICTPDIGYTFDWGGFRFFLSVRNNPRARTGCGVTEEETGYLIRSSQGGESLEDCLSGLQGMLHEPDMLNIIRERVRMVKQTEDWKTFDQLRRQHKEEGR